MQGIHITENNKKAVNEMNIMLLNLVFPTLPFMCKPFFSQMDSSRNLLLDLPTDVLNLCPCVRVLVAARSKLPHFISKFREAWSNSEHKVDVNFKCQHKTNCKKIRTLNRNGINQPYHQTIISMMIQCT